MLTTITCVLAIAYFVINTIINAKRFSLELKAIRRLS